MALQGPEELGEPMEESEDLDDHDASNISPAEEIPLPAGPGGEDEDPAGNTVLLPWDRFSTWLHCICVVGFDLELGQAVEVREDPWRSAGSSEEGSPLGRLPNVGVLFRALTNSWTRKHKSLRKTVCSLQETDGQKTQIAC